MLDVRFEPRSCVEVGFRIGSHWTDWRLVQGHKQLVDFRCERSETGTAEVFREILKDFEGTRPMLRGAPHKAQKQQNQKNQEDQQSAKVLWGAWFGDASDSFC